MHINFDKNIDIPLNNIDVCIIGSGATGTIIFDLLAKKNYNILLIESGDITPAGEAQGLNEGYLYLNGSKSDDKVAEIKSALQWRTRGLGGSTNCWSGACKPFHSLTFLKRDWIKNSGWDLKEDQITKYYHIANKYTEIDSTIFDEGLWKLIGETEPLKENDELSTNFAIRSGYLDFKSNEFLDWPGPTRFSKYLNNDKYKKSENKNIIYNSTVVDLTYDSNRNEITSCTITNNSHYKKTIKSKYFILCSGGFENPRLMLIANNRNGVGNKYDNVGRYYNGHPYGTVADLICNNKEVSTKLGWSFQYHKIYNNRCMPHLYVTEETQIKYKLLNTAFNLVPELDITSASYIIKTIIDKKSINDLNISLDNMLIVMSEIDDVLNNTYRKITNKGAKLRLKESIPIEYIAEGIPKYSSRISLSNKKDKFGCPKINYNWQIDSQEIDNLYSSLNILASTVAKNRWGKIKVREQSLPTSTDYFKGLTDAAHPSGGTRISNDPKKGVVDTNLKVHYLNNLYVCGSSVFPTNGYESPTYTLVALAARLASELENRLSKI